MPPLQTAAHYEIWKYYPSTSNTHAKVLHIWGGVGAPGPRASGQQVEVVTVQVERVLLLPSPAGPGRATPADSSTL